MFFCAKATGCWSNECSLSELKSTVACPSSDMRHGLAFLDENVTKLHNITKRALVSETLSQALEMKNRPNPRGGGGEGAPGRHGGTHCTNVSSSTQHPHTCLRLSC